MLPVFITGDPRRDYTFQFILFQPLFVGQTDYTLNAGALHGVDKTVALEDRLTAANQLVSFNVDLDTATLIYVSQLCKQISLPEDKIRTRSVKLGGVDVSFIEGFEMADFTCTYLEDEVNNVYKTFLRWQRHMSPLASSSYRKLAVYPLLQRCLTGIYIPTKKVKIPGADNAASVVAGIPLIGSLLSSLLGPEVPTGIFIYPYIYPSNIKRSNPDKSGNAFGTVEVTYSRVPDIETFVPYAKVMPSI
jgi:hypothetical protein